MKKQGKAMEVYELAKVFEEFKAGDNVKFAPTHALAGTLGVVAGITADGMIQVKVGKALQPPVAASEIIKLEMGQPVSGEAPVSTTPADLPVTQA